tara:strand:- start:3129 stop:3530 length:402 start_codon:yes stop_codon:yes gene_type:complete
MEETLALIKPDAVKRNIIGNIILLIEKDGFIIKKMKMMKMSEEIAKQFYSVHSEKPFYTKLIEYMTSGNIVALVLEKDNAVIAYRQLIGSTNPEEAEENTIRKLYAIDQSHNSVHGSDSVDNAINEISLIFNE